ncbi:MAG: 50S ribosomal protein L15 [Candidatus Omnitrophica bacterium CG11_big_fil_rev_8_21_14_0_20_41_12]|nr:MAG: 50S ribosomal protein L15 [Candidatus Omnitrophica bacterium CG11_big_fil_rev_8_21_14_0_20_41_12]
MKDKKSVVKPPIKKPKVVHAAKKPITVEPKKVLAKGLSLYNLKRPFGSHKKRKYLGRGSSSGHGKTSTRGSKGQTSRAGRHFYLGFEGGQSPLIRRMPKRGFVSNFKKVYQVVNLTDLNSIKDVVITPLVLKESGLIRSASALVKILGNGSIKNAVTIQAHAFSKRASSEIVSAGGKAEVINV